MRSVRLTTIFPPCRKCGDKITTVYLQGRAITACPTCHKDNLNGMHTPKGR